MLTIKSRSRHRCIGSNILTASFIAGVSSQHNRSLTHSKNVRCQNIHSELVEQEDVYRFAMTLHSPSELLTGGVPSDHCKENESPCSGYFGQLSDKAEMGITSANEHRRASKVGIVAARAKRAEDQGTLSSHAYQHPSRC